ncbi:hypothetical protein JCM17846_26880 [Iodidimonas nitroreducens]|uniref:Uncharacterized protein n=1 Tax=Iodidimonas nitroreducens TaxID=1236968 RepID=A0A5A7NDK1_9PROT|nr:hypothetical protein [Iodidimonas nitroreducens]GAK34218.1 hypothetical protein AQ1_02115 [alpha proteobacterium Q-1]GER05006.1 hypothetical protein JCM17846_26880 [Iodidimonas nitroreducens]
MQHKQKCASFPPELQVLYDQAKNIPVSAGDAEAQRQSFAYGNAKIENDRITPNMIAQAADHLKG